MACLTTCEGDQKLKEMDTSKSSSLLLVFQVPVQRFRGLKENLEFCFKTRSSWGTYGDSTGPVFPSLCGWFCSLLVTEFGETGGLADTVTVPAVEEAV